MLTLFRRLFQGGPVSGAQAPAQPPEAPPALNGEAPHLAPLLRAAGFGDAEPWTAALARPMRAHAIAGPRRVAAFLATIAHESNGGRRLEENLSYSAHRLVAVWPRRFPTLQTAYPYERNPEGLAERVYGGRMGNVRPGDGWRYRGRGLIMLTGAAGYAEAAEATGLPLLSQPDLAAEPEGAAAIACWWWHANGCNELADAGEVEPWRKRVNGGLIGLDDVRRRYVAVLAELGAEVLGA